jgi:hypothetical protein
LRKGQAEEKLGTQQLILRLMIVEHLKISHLKNQVKRNNIFLNSYLIK